MKTTNKTMEGNIKIRPLFDNVVVKKDEIEEKTKSGIYVEANDQTALVGTVVSVGKEVEDEIKTGDRIMYAPFSGRELGGFLILAQHDIMGVVEKDEVIKIKDLTIEPHALDERCFVVLEEDGELLATFEDHDTAEENKKEAIEWVEKYVSSDPK